jgi:NAD(P)-dependent dehydrogenase (short-subunit alcohol dehydrogenase family)
MGRLTGKVAIVTGGASNPGLGHETAVTLAREGARLFVTDVDIAGAEACAAKIRAAELGKHQIRCNSVHPGVIWTGMQEQARAGNRAAADEAAKSMPLGFVGAPSDIASCVLYLASDESRYVTGAEFTVDAGMTAV